MYVCILLQCNVDRCEQSIAVEFHLAVCNILFPAAIGSKHRPDTSSDLCCEKTEVFGSAQFLPDPLYSIMWDWKWLKLESLSIMDYICISRNEELKLTYTNFTVSEVTTLWWDRNVCIIIIFFAQSRRQEN